MIKLLSTLVLFFNCFYIFAQNQKVTNVAHRQEQSNIIVSYNLETTAPCKINLYISRNDGKSWEGPLKKVKGDVGENISSGEHSITWSVLEEFDEFVGENIKFGVRAEGDEKNENITNNSKSSTTSKFSLDRFESIDSGFLIKVKMPGFREGLAYLCYHWGKNLNIADSAIVGSDEVVVFKGGKKLVGGIYAVVFPGKNLTFDFFIDKEQVINIYADSKELQNVVVKGSSENPLFQAYQKYVSVKGSLLQQERMAYNESKTKADSLLHEKNFDKYNKELIAFRDSIMKNYPKSLMSVMLNTMREPEILIKNPKTREDSLNNYYHYRNHYWDGVTFMDERIIRTPFFIPKLERYYRDVVIQAPDSIIKDVDYRLLYARNNQEMYKFMLNWLTDEYINPKIMGQDAVFVHLFEKYHNKGESPWLNEKQMEIVTRNAYMKMMNLIGKPAADIDMIDSTGRHRPLYEQKADYMVLVFWDPTCGHCKEEIPRIDSFYKVSWKAHGVKIYSVLSDNDKYKEWVNYLKERKGLSDWINVYETKEMEKSIADNKLPGFRQLYDVNQTPTILLVDKDKRIIAKKLGVKQLHDFMVSKWGEKK